MSLYSLTLQILKIAMTHNRLLDTVPSAINLLDSLLGDTDIGDGKEKILADLVSSYLEEGGDLSSFKATSKPMSAAMSSMMKPESQDLVSRAAPPLVEAMEEFSSIIKGEGPYNMWEVMVGLSTLEGLLAVFRYRLERSELGPEEEPDEI